MSTQGARTLNWSGTTVLVAIMVSIAGLLSAFLLEQLGAWPDIAFLHFAFGGLAGATAVNKRHPGHPLASFVVFVPVLSVLLGFATLLFNWYVLGNSI